LKRGIVQPIAYGGNKTFQTLWSVDHSFSIWHVWADLLADIYSDILLQCLLATFYISEPGDPASVKGLVGAGKL